MLKYCSVIFIILFISCDYNKKTIISIDSPSFKLSEDIFFNFNKPFFQNVQINYEFDSNCSENLILKKIDACITTNGLNKNDSINFQLNNIKPLQQKIASDGVIIVVNSTNIVEILEELDIEKIFLGDIQFWDELGGSSNQIIVYKLENETEKLFSELVINSKNIYDLAIGIDNINLMIESIEEDYNSIGFIRASQLNEVITKLKIISIKYPKIDLIIVPLLKNIKSLNYKYSRNYYLQTTLPMNSTIEIFYKEIISDKIQKNLENKGYITLKK